MHSYLKLLVPYLILQVNKRTPYHSVNFVIAHDGFTLYDLVSYDFKVPESFKSIRLLFKPSLCSPCFYCWFCSTMMPMEKVAMMETMIISAGIVVMKVCPDFYAGFYDLIFIIIEHSLECICEYTSSLFACPLFWTGETDDNSIIALRPRQMKNFHLALVVSQVHTNESQIHCIVWIFLIIDKMMTSKLECVLFDNSEDPKLVISPSLFSLNCCR